MTPDAAEVWSIFSSSFASAHLDELAARLWFQAEERAGRGWDNLTDSLAASFAAVAAVADDAQREPWRERARAALAELQLLGLVEPVRFKPDRYTRVVAAHEFRVPRS